MDFLSSRLFLNHLMLVVYQQKLQIGTQLKNYNTQSSVRQLVLSINWDDLTAVLLYLHYISM